MSDIDEAIARETAAARRHLTIALGAAALLSRDTPNGFIIMGYIKQALALLPKKSHDPRG